MIAAVAFAAMMAAQLDPIPGSDKLKHFFVSAFVHSVVFSSTRAAGLPRPDAQVAAAVSTMSVGVLKEISDRRKGRGFSVPDLAWDAAGALAAASLLNGTR